MKIIRGRLKSLGRSAEFISVQGRIKGLITKHSGETIDFVVDDNGVKTVKSFGPDDINPDLVGQKVAIVNDTAFALFNEDGTIELVHPTNESLPRQQTVDQLKKLRKISKSTDIGDRISNMNKQGSNIQYYRNAVDSGIESYEDFEKKNKSFVPSWNLKHLISPFRNDNGHGK